MDAAILYPIVAGVIGFFVLSGVGGGIFAGATRGSRRRKRYVNSYTPKTSRKLPERVAQELSVLRKDVERLVELDQFSLAERVGEVIRLTQVFFEKLHDVGHSHAADMAAVNYSDVLAKLNQALSDNYYFDMIVNPQMWTRVEERKSLVSDVTEAIIDELMTSIRDFNSNSDVRHDVNLEALLERAQASQILEDLR